MIILFLIAAFALFVFVYNLRDHIERKRDAEATRHRIKQAEIELARFREEEQKRLLEILEFLEENYSQSWATEANLLKEIDLEIRSSFPLLKPTPRLRKGTEG